jgi:diguanylate cyclase (GGDEF)-like protein
MNTPQNRRILLVDDMPAIHEDFRKIFAPQSADDARLSAVEAALFGDEPSAATAAATAAYELDSAYQGQEGLAMVQSSLKEDRPYAMAFVDMRMPSGWDGVETIERLWQADPRLQVVICTAYTDTPWVQVLARLDVRDRLLILKKPFDAIEVYQLATALTAKWQMTQDAARKMVSLEVAVQLRTVELRAANDALRLAATELQDVHEKLKHQATHDALTGLPNRSLLHDRLEQAISYAHRYHRLVTVVYMDLDQFKSINDTLGHQAGDDLLKVVAGRMAGCVRSVDTVVRMGGDEFVIVLFDQPEKGGTITPMLERLRETIAQPLEIGGQTLQVTASMGLATYPTDGTSVSAMLMNADTAMYRAKALGRNNYQFYMAETNVQPQDE